MSAKTTAYGQLLCPMPDCDEELHIRWIAYHSVNLSNLIDGQALAQDDAEGLGWQIECLGDHVILTPGRLGCPCLLDQDGSECPHDAEIYDWSEDYRTFRAHDAERLHALIKLLYASKAVAR